jgi:hypothetical protein
MTLGFWNAVTDNENTGTVDVVTCLENPILYCYYSLYLEGLIWKTEILLT